MGRKILLGLLVLFDVIVRPDGIIRNGMAVRVTTESLEGKALTLEGVDDVRGGHSLPLGLLRVGDCAVDDYLKENLKTLRVSS
jgi:hypothetical protein